MHDLKPREEKRMRPRSVLHETEAETETNYCETETKTETKNGLEALTSLET